MPLGISRKEGESVFIGSNIEVYVKGIDRDRVFLGIKAPKDVLILRGELRDRMLEQEKEKRHGTQ